MYRFGNSLEDLCIKKIEGGIRAIKAGLKSPKEAELSFSFQKLKPLNEGMYSDLMDKYKDVVKEWKDKNENQ